ncbi:LytS/YehU family sensor histidine kinase [Olleya aquimaris]|uniref:LytS/YehU family sensor histidine kinase n=2 Tax=Olleya aquimaris TaxID=639310 RepID=A0A327RMQ1_9FLAO|nr:LytS/YehU family sensor histidine kinase [Olleya aquimaris]
MFNFGKEIVKAFFIGILVFLVRGLIMYMTGVKIEANYELFLDFVYNQLYAVVLYLANAYFVSYMMSKYKHDLFKPKNLLVAGLLSVSISMIAIFALRFFILVILKGYDASTFFAGEKFIFYWFSLTISITITAAFYIVYYLKSRQDTKVKEQKVIAGTASAKFDALKNQLDPHFLFNSLNVLTSLIEENPDSAQKFTTSLSKVYRYVLEQKNKDLVTVDEELQFAKTYMSLIKMRFEDSIVFDIPEQAQHPESKVVPLSLQLLLENAVKHNIVTSSKPLHIKIYESNGNLIVVNNLQTKDIVKKSSGVGLENIKQRYQLLTNKRVSISQDNTSFKVAIPILTKEISVMRQLPEKQFDDSYVRARKHVEELKEFYYNLISYCFVIPFLIFINYKTSWDYKWFWFPMFGWALGIVFHAYKVFVNDGMLGKSWEEKQIKKYMEEDNQQRWN